MEENREKIGRREREKQLRRMEILTASLKLFSKNGYENTTIDEIALESEFGKGTIYNYFENKDEIYGALVEYLALEYFKRIVEIDNETENLREFLYRIVFKMIEISKSEPETFNFLVRYKIKSKLANNFENEVAISTEKKIERIYINKIKKAINEGEIRNLDVNSLIGILRNVLGPYIFMVFSKMNHNIVEETEFVISLIFDGIKKK